MTKIHKKWEQIEDNFFTTEISLIYELLLSAVDLCLILSNLTKL